MSDPYLSEESQSIFHFESGGFFSLQKQPKPPTKQDEILGKSTFANWMVSILKKGHYSISTIVRQSTKEYPIYTYIQYPLHLFNLQYFNVQFSDSLLVGVSSWWFFLVIFWFHSKSSVETKIDGTWRTPLCSHTFLPETAPNSGLSQGFGTCYLEKNTKIWGRRCGFSFEHGFCYQEGPLFLLVSSIFFGKFSPLGKWSNLTTAHIFHMGWWFNHQVAEFDVTNIVTVFGHQECQVMSRIGPWRIGIVAWGKLGGTHWKNHRKSHGED